MGQLNSARDKGVDRKEEQISTGNIEKKERDGDGEKESKMEAKLAGWHLLKHRVNLVQLPCS